MLAAATALLALQACRQHLPDPADTATLPSGAYAPYVEAFTGGYVGTREPVVVQLTEPVAGVEVGPADENLLRIRPAVGGELVWRSPLRLAFVPDAGVGFRQNTAYTATLDLRALRPDVPDSLARLSFGFATGPQSYTLSEPAVEPAAASPTEPTRRQLSGVVYTADYAEPTAVEAAAVFAQAERQLPATWTHADGNRIHRYVVGGVERRAGGSEVRVRFDGSSLGSGLRDTSFRVSVPDLTAFTVTGVDLAQDGDQVVTLSLSDPVDPAQDLTGLVHVAGGTPLRLLARGSELLAYPTQRIRGAVELTVEPQLRSVAGARLGERLTRTLDFSELTPGFELLGEGTIVPTSAGATIPLRAVGLRSLRVEVVRVFTENVTQFLQDNQLDTRERLTRVGRPVYQGRVTLRPDGAAAPDATRWRSYGLQLDELIRVEPGAIYAVAVDFEPEDVDYACAEGVLAQAAAELGPRERHDLEAAFDRLRYYYSFDDGGYYYEDEDEPRDPCTADYYRGRRRVRNFLASDIGLLAKRAPGGPLLVAATDLTTAGPLAGVEVELLNPQRRPIARAATDADGVAVFAAEHEPFLAVARMGTQRGYLRLDEASALSVSSFDVGGESLAGDDRARGLIYGERGVWRPGDSIYLSLMLEREAREAAVPVVFELRDPSGALLESRAVAEAAPGMYDLRTATSPDAPTGPYRAVVRAGAGRITRTVRVEAVLPNRLTADLAWEAQLGERDGVPVVDLARSDEVTLSARWLHGAPAGALQADAELTVRPVRAPFPQHPGFAFADETRALSLDGQRVYEGRLQADGTRAFALGLDDPTAAPGLLDARLSLRVHEATGGISTVARSARLSPYPAYVGVRVPESESYYGLRADRPQRFELIAVDAEGEPAEREQLRVEVYDLRWSYWWERDRDGAAPFASYVANRAQHLSLDTLVRLSDSRGSALLDLSALDYGRKLIRVVDPEGGHAATSVFYLEDPRWAYDPSSRPGGAELLAFNLDRETYSVGDEVRVSLPAFPGGRALVTVEGGRGVLERRWVDGRAEPQDLTLRAASAMAPNAYVSVHVVQPHAQTANDQPIRLYGVQALRVEDPDRRLRPQMALAEELAPEEAFEVRVSEADGRAMSYTLAIVDEGLLDVTGFRTPDPYARFHQRVALGVRTWDLYRHVLGAFTGKLAGLLAIGGDEDTGEAPDPRANRFRPVVRHVGPFRLAPGATATHRFEMPNYVGSVRAMVVATDAGAYGSAEETRPVRRPLMALATLPRVLGPGETTELAVTVFATEPAIRDVAVRLDGLELLTAVDRSQTLRFGGQGGERIARFVVRAPEELGVARVRVRVEGGGYRASDEIELQVRAPNPEVAEVDAAVLEPGESWTTDLAALGIPGTNAATLEVSASLPVDLERRMRYLLRYPHGCLEQTVSAAFPQLYVGEFTRMSPARERVTQRNVSAALRALTRFRRGDGAYDYWPGTGNVAAWATTYAGHFMLEARERGYRVDEGALADWRRAERRAANAWSPRRRAMFAYELPATQAYRLFALARAGHPELGAMNRLRGEPELPRTATLLLAGAYGLAGQRDAARLLLAGSGEAPEASDDAARRYTYGSQLRDLAIELYVRELLGDREGAFRLAREVSGRLSSPAWHSTQATAWGLIAMARYAAGERDDVTAPLRYVYRPGAAEELAVDQGEQLRLTELADANAAQGQLALRNTGQRRLYARLVRRGEPSTSQRDASASGLRIAVAYTDLGGQPVDPATLRQGQDFVATTTVTHPGGAADYHELALTEIFPSGWEIRNERLAGGTAPAGLDYRDVRDDRVLSYFDLPRGTQRTMRVQLTAAYPGRYYLPERSCEAMYDAGVAARLPGRWVEVAPARSETAGL